MLALLGIKHQILAADFNFATHSLSTNTAMHTAQAQRQQICAQSDINGIQGHICRDANQFTLLDIAPQAHRAAAFLQGQTFVHRHPLTKGGKVNMGQLSK